MPCPVVESRCGKRVERSVREKDLRRSTKKRIFKGLKTGKFVGKGEKERHRAVSSEKNLYKVVEVEVRQKDCSV